MKKLITICLFMATTFTVNAQTKEETISWLKEKFIAYLIPNASGDEVYLKSIDECQFTAIYNLTRANGSVLRLEYIIPFDGLDVHTGIGNVRDVIICIENGKVTYQNFTFLYIRNAEQDIYLRILKAAQHLTTFCPKKKETF